MKNAKMILLAASAVLVSLSAVSVQAQGLFGGPQGGPLGGPPVAAVTTPLETLSSVLTLTSAQQTQVSGIQSDFHQQIQVIAPRPNDGGGFGQGRPAPPDAATRTKIDSLVTSESSQIEALLTPTQTAALTVLLAQLKELKDAQIPTRLYTQLALSTDQYSQIAKIEATANASLKQAVDQAAVSGDYDSVQQSIADSHRQIHTQVVALLTPTQASLINDGRGGGPDGFQGPPPGSAGPGGDDSQSQTHAGGFGGGPGGGGFGGGPGGNNPGGPPQGGGDQSQQSNGDSSAF